MLFSRSFRDRQGLGAEPCKGSETRVALGSASFELERLSSLVSDLPYPLLVSRAPSYLGSFVSRRRLPRGVLLCCTALWHIAPIVP